LRIEGIKVEGFTRPRDIPRDGIPEEYQAPYAANEIITGKTIREFVERYVRRAGALEARDKTKAEHLQYLRDGKDKWNEWRRECRHVQPMLACVDASRDFPGKCLDEYDFSYANLTEAKLQHVHLKRANFHQAILAGADLTDAHLEDANFCRTDMYRTNLSEACLRGANLQGVQLAMTILRGADLRDCLVYGMSTWDVDLEGAQQQNLAIRYRPVPGEDREETAVVDSLDLAAFMYLTINNRNIGRIIEAAGRKWVLVLGRFTKGKEVLIAIQDALKYKQFIPVIFDFDRPEQRDLIETIILLAGMSAFVIVEMSDPRSTPLELQAIASNYGVPIFPVMREDAEAFGMFPGLRKFRWVFPPLKYSSKEDLSERLEAEVIEPALAEVRRLSEWKRRVEAP
jgi:hypothetical protein